MSEEKFISIKLDDNEDYYYPIRSDTILIKDPRPLTVQSIAEKVVEHLVREMEIKVDLLIRSCSSKREDREVVENRVGMLLWTIDNIITSPHDWTTILKEEK